MSLVVQYRHADEDEAASQFGLERAVGVLTKSYDGFTTSLEAELFSTLEQGVNYLIVVREPEFEVTEITPTARSLGGIATIPIEEQLVEAEEGTFIYQSQTQAQAVVMRARDEISDPETGLQASATAILSLETNVTENEDGISANASAVLAIESDVYDPDTGVQANADAVLSLDTRVTANDDDISSNASAILSLESTVNDPDTGVQANADAVLSLDTRVTSNDGDISSNASAIIDIEADVYDPDTGLSTVATATFNMEADVYDPDTGLAEAHAKISLKVNADDVVAAINLTADTIDGARVEVTGDTTFTDDVKIKGRLETGDAIVLPSTFTNDRSGRIDSGGMEMVYDGSTSQSIDWYSGLGTFAARYTANDTGALVESDFDITIDAGGNIKITTGLLGEISLDNSLLADVGMTQYRYNNSPTDTATGEVSLGLDVPVFKYNNNNEPRIVEIRTGSITAVNGMKITIVNGMSNIIYLRDKSQTTHGDANIRCNGLANFQILPGTHTTLVRAGGDWFAPSDRT